MRPDLRTLSGNPASAYAFGCMQFGDGADETASKEMYDACRAAGINHFDTAHVYTDGQSETMLGKFAAPERDDVFIASKANYPGGNGRENILNSLDESRQRLGTEVIDLYYLHRWDGDVPLEESFATLAKAQKDGAIRHIGVSNFAAWQVMKAQCIAKDLGTRIDVIQPMYNLVKRQAEVELLPMCESEGIVPVPYSPLGGGLLTGKYVGGGKGRITDNAMYAKRYAQEEAHHTAARLKTVATEMRLHPATMAVAWVARHSSHPVPILSARSAAQLEPSLAATHCTMDDKTYAFLNSISVTPPPATDRLEEA